MEKGRPVKRMKIGGSVGASFPTLPVEILLIVFGHCDVISRIRLRRVSKKWNSILRDSAVWRTINITEQERTHFHRTNHASSLPRFLSKAGVFKHVKHLVLEGDYELSNQEPHGGEQPFSPVEIIAETILDNKVTEGNFEKLERIVIRKAPLVFDQLDVLALRNLKCQLTIESGSIVVPDNEEWEPWYLEVEIPESRTFNLCGTTGWLDRLAPVVRASKEPGDWYIDLPLEVAEFVAETCNAVPTEVVAGLGGVYADLLKGRDGLVIRWDVQTLFDEVVVTTDENDGYDPDKKHWEQCRDYDFSTITNWHKYALVYYSRPRNCYTLPSAESPFSPKDL